MDIVDSSELLRFQKLQRIEVEIADLKIEIAIVDRDLKNCEIEQKKFGRRLLCQEHFKSCPS